VQQLIGDHYRKDIGEETTMRTAKEAIYARQKSWATKCGIPVDAAGYTLTVDKNLFQPLSVASKSEFGLGRGNELGSATNRGKMQATHSSSALACNFFDYWRDKPLTPLASALGAPSSISEIHFEQIYRTIINTRPNLDVALFGNGVKPFLIESKFVEPYGSDKSGKIFKGAYFPDGLGLWEQHNLTQCQVLAQKIQSRHVEFSRLDAQQLLKHILGLANEHSEGFTLLYLWYDWPSPEATEHRAEIERFAQAVGGEIEFRAMTYQDLFREITNTTSGGYLAYLAARYF